MTKIGQTQFIHICNICIINCKIFVKFLAIFEKLLYDIWVQIREKIQIKMEKWKGAKIMKKTLAVFAIIIMVISLFTCTNKVYATDAAIDNRTESKLVEIKESQTKSLQDYQEKYGSDSYGLVAYILNLVRIYSIPFCFLGIAIGAIHQYIIGIRKLDTLEKGMGLVVTFVTLLIICQVLPLAFAMFVKFGRG